MYVCACVCVVSQYHKSFHELLIINHLGIITDVIYFNSAEAWQKFVQMWLEIVTSKKNTVFKSSVMTQYSVCI